MTTTERMIERLEREGRESEAEEIRWSVLELARVALPYPVERVTYRSERRAGRERNWMPETI